MSAVSDSADHQRGWLGVWHRLRSRAAGSSLPPSPPTWPGLRGRCSPTATSSLATVGRPAAVADLRRLRLAGYVAWLVWWLVHISSLIDFRSRLQVMSSWAWQYWTGRRARLITETFHSASSRRRSAP